MASTAISAQLSKLRMGTGTGGAKTISAITLGNPTLLTLTAHGLTNGTVVALAGLTGTDASLLNGQSLPLQFVTTNTVAVAVDTTGKTVTAAGTATPVTYTQIKNLVDFTPPEGTSSEIDVTNMDSTAKEYIAGLVDNGSLSCNVHTDNADAGQLAARAAQQARTVMPWTLTLPNGTVASFSGFVKSFGGGSGAVDAALKQSLAIRISGAVTWA